MTSTPAERTAAREAVARGRAGPALGTVARMLSIGIVTRALVTGALLATGLMGRLEAQGRPKEVECSFLLFAGCRNYAIEVIRVEPGGPERRQADADTYQIVDPDTLDPSRYLVLELYDGDRLQGTRSVIWVERVSGAVGGDWPSTLKNDAVRSAELRGVPGDLVELYDSRDRRVERGLARMVVFSGKDSCVSPANLGQNVGGCMVKEGAGVAGKVSFILIKYRAAAADSVAPPGAGPPAPPAQGIPAQPALPDTARPLPAPPDTTRAPGAAPDTTRPMPAPSDPADAVPEPAPPPRQASRLPPARFRPHLLASRAAPRMPRQGG